MNKVVAQAGTSWLTLHGTITVSEFTHGKRESRHIYFQKSSHLKHKMNITNIKMHAEFEQMSRIDLNESIV